MDFNKELQSKVAFCKALNQTHRRILRGFLALFTLAVITACSGGSSDGTDPTAPPVSGSPPPAGGGSDSPPPAGGGSDSPPPAGGGSDSPPPAGGGSDSPPPTGGGSGPPPPDEEPPVATIAISGFVIDGPVSGADVVVRDANGKQIAQTTSDANARFQVDIPEAAQFPITITATGGINLTTGAEPGFPITGVITDSGQREVVLSSLSSLFVSGAACEGLNLQAASFGSHELSLLERHGFGLDAADRERLLTGVPSTPAEAGRLLLAAEALAESLRRAAAALRATDGMTEASDVLEAIATCPDETDATAVRRRAAFHAAATAVKLELSIGELRVLDRTEDAVPLLQDAIASTFGVSGDFVVSDLPLPADAFDQLLRSVHAALAAAPSDELFELYTTLFGLPPDMTRAELGALLQPSDSLFDQLAALIASVNKNDDLARGLLDRNDIVMGEVPPPAVDLTAETQDLDARGASAMLNYSAENATLCRRRASSVAVWSGFSGPEAGVSVGPVNGIETFNLICAGPGGLTAAQVQITVPPFVEIRFVNLSGDNPDVIFIGATLRVELDVLDASIEDCEVVRTDNTDDPAGTMIAVGQELTADPGLTISATCTGINPASSMNLASVPLLNTHIVWLAPNRLENGEPLTDLAGYEIHYGPSPSNYAFEAGGGVRVIDNPLQLEHTEAFPATARFFAIRAVTSDDRKSAFSNEAFKRIP
ncbi:MAG: hypothetical protein JJT88_18105 [Gammaproteobacteria bacterium]|nr:hypothetical protein [Gammaproteobacteria bacterium]